MKIEWVILIVSAVTDFIINAGTALMAVMVATGSPQMPSDAVLVITAVGGLVSAARTVQQALKITPEITAKLRGETSPNKDG